MDAFLLKQKPDSPSKPDGHGYPFQRFIIEDQDTDNVIMDRPFLGYRGIEHGGRFIFAFPIEHSEGEKPRSMVELNRTNTLPADFIRSNKMETTDLVINPKYCAAFIDATSLFHPNNAFMQSDKPFPK